MARTRFDEWPPARGAWRQLVDAVARAAGPFPRPLLRSWRAELDAVEALVRLLERAAPGAAGPVPRDGTHALLALAGARLGSGWSSPRLVAAATAVELAHRATRHHSAVTDDGLGARGANTWHVLDGDWSITEAATLAAELGPVAYRLLVRGYGAAQLARLGGDRGAAAAALFPAAISLGAFVAHVDDVGFPLAVGASPAAVLLGWACSLAGDQAALAVPS